MSDPLDRARIDRVGDVERRLAELWNEAAAREDAVVRSCTMNLVVACGDARELTAATRDVSRLAEHFPARAIVAAPLRETAADKGEIEVYVSSHSHSGGSGVQVLSEQVTLEVPGDGWPRVPASVLRLLAGDCPVYCWWRRPLLAADPLFDPLVRLSDRLVVDSAVCGEPAAALSALCDVAVDRSLRAEPGDLAWVRLAPWLELAASLFDPPALRPWLRGVRRIECVTGGPSCGGGWTIGGAYLAGWLASRLGWETEGGELRRGAEPVTAICSEDDALAPGEPGSLRLEAEADGRPASFEIRRPDPQETMVRLAVEVEGTCPLPIKQRIERPDDVTLLGYQLERPAADPLFADALAAAASLATGPGRN